MKYQHRKSAALRRSVIGGFLILSLCIGFSCFLMQQKTDPDVNAIRALVETGSDDELWTFHYELWREYKNNGKRPKRVWSAHTCQRIFNAIFESMIATDSETRVHHLFICLFDLIQIQKDHFVLDRLCSERQFAAIRDRLEQYNDKVDFRIDKLSIKKHLLPTGEFTIELVITHITP